MYTALANAGIQVNFFDLRGHGRSSGPSAAATIKDFLDDLDAVFSKVEKGTPKFFYGVSEGSILKNIS